MLAGQRLSDQLRDLDAAPVMRRCMASRSTPRPLNIASIITSTVSGATESYLESRLDRSPPNTGILDTMVLRGDPQQPCKGGGGGSSGLRGWRSGGSNTVYRHNGEMTHTIVAAQNGSWTTSALQSGRWKYVTLDQPGTFLYHCTDHPWAIGEITVEP